jgi:hypothetical protein
MPGGGGPGGDSTGMAGMLAQSPEVKARHAASHAQTDQQVLFHPCCSCSCMLHVASVCCSCVCYVMYPCSLNLCLGR